MQKAVFKPKEVVKVAGSKRATDTVGGWAYLVNWEKYGRPDDDGSDADPEAEVCFSFLSTDHVTGH